METKERNDPASRAPLADGSDGVPEEALLRMIADHAPFGRSEPKRHEEPAP